MCPIVVCPIGSVSNLPRPIGPVSNPTVSKRFGVQFYCVETVRCPILPFPIGPTAPTILCVQTACVQWIQSPDQIIRVSNIPVSNWFCVQCCCVQSDLCIQCYCHISNRNVSNRSVSNWFDVQSYCVQLDLCPVFLCPITCVQSVRVQSECV